MHPVKPDEASHGIPFASSLTQQNVALGEVDLFVATTVTSVSSIPFRGQPVRYDAEASLIWGLTVFEVS